MIFEIFWWILRSESGRENDFWLLKTFFHTLWHVSGATGSMETYPRSMEKCFEQPKIIFREFFRSENDLKIEFQIGPKSIEKSMILKIFWWILRSESDRKNSWKIIFGCSKHFSILRVYVSILPVGPDTYHRVWKNVLSNQK